MICTPINAGKAVIAQTIIRIYEFSNLNKLESILLTESWHGVPSNDAQTEFQ